MQRGTRGNCPNSQQAAKYSFHPQRASTGTAVMLSSWIAVSRFEALPLFTVVCLAASDVGISVPVLQAATR